MRLKPHLSIYAFALLIAGLSPAAAQVSASDIVLRLEALENQVRQLTGQVEQLQYRNQQLEQQLRGAGVAPAPAQPQRPVAPPRRSEIDQPAPQAADPRYPDPRYGADPRYPDQRYGTDPRAPAVDPRYAHSANPDVVTPPPSGGRRGDAFDPNANPNAPGVPRPLGALQPGQPSVPPIADQDDGGRAPGAPLVLSPEDAARRGIALPPPPDRPGSGTGVAAVQPPGDTPKDYLDLGIGFMRQKDYAAAEQSFRDFLERFPSDRLAPDAHYWLGESLFNRKQYQDAAEAYLVVTTKYETAARAPNALLRLGQSLAAIRQKEMACASFAEIGRKYPRSSVAVKQAVEREQKRVGC
jgi:tol-pal system protein YbgF